jgi:malonyl-CoA O-methyltransferase
MTEPFDTRQIRRSFGRAASAYAETAVLQKEVESRLLEQLDYVEKPPARIVDIGSGPGRASAALKQRWPKAQVIAVDMALPMLQQAKKAAGWWRPRFSCINADATALPLADGSVDLLFSSLCIQWVADLPALFREWRRVVSPGGMVLLSSFGPDTLHELRAAFAAVDRDPHVSPFAPIQAVGDALLASGFRDPVLDTDTFTLTYRDARALMHELRTIGAGNALRTRRKSLTGKAHMQRVYEAYEPFRRDGVLPASYEVIYAHAWGPPAGQPLRGASGDLAAVPIAGIPIRRRGE